MKLSTEEIRMLAQVERDMDAGNQPFVICHGQRWAFTSDILEDNGVESGQTVSPVIIEALLKSSIASLNAKIAITEARISSKGDES